MRRGTDIREIVSMPPIGGSTAYVDDRLQVADILEWILDSHSNAHPGGKGTITVYQTTFSISDEFLRRIYTIGRNHPRCVFEVVIDRKALQKITQLAPFIRRVYDRVYISDNHSKILLVDFGHGDMTALVTSQNLTRGNRHESAVLSRDPSVTSRLLEDYKDLIKNRSAHMFEVIPLPAESLMQRAAENSAPFGADDGSSPASAAGPSSASGNNASSASGINSVPAVSSGSESADVSPSSAEAKLLTEIERLAGYFVPPSDIATVLGIDHMELRDAISSRHHPWGLAYRRGKAKAKISVRAKEMEFAEMGSPVAIQNVRENLIDMESEED